VVEGPVCGDIYYRPDMFAPSNSPEIPVVAVMLDAAQGFFHPNVKHGHVCLGAIPPGPFPLVQLLMYLCTILSYSNYAATDALNPEAAALFALDPDEALRGLDPMPPLY